MPSDDANQTPTSEHQPVLLAPAIAALNVRADGVYVDATYGRGGHARALLAQLGQAGRLLALDRDPQAVANAQQLRDARFSITHASFSRLSEVLRQAGVERIDGVLLDLGVSSPQLDDPNRGFSFRADAPLDMRMDTTQGESAAQWLQRASQQELEGVIKRYGEERFAKQIARAIVASAQPLRTTRQLAEIVARAVPTREPGQDPATRTFQAIRIYLNRELEELEIVLPQVVALLKPGGRLVVISFHSLEDRIVKRFIQAMSNPVLPRRLPLTAAMLPKAQMRGIGKAVRASADELARNPRARSAIMRVAERLPT